MKRILLVTAALLLIAALALPASADTPVFTTGSTNYLNGYFTDYGYGQGISVSTTQTITDMAVYLNMPDGGDINFMIWNGTNSNLLYSQEDSVAASNEWTTGTWVESSPFSFTLQAGQTYYFGVTGDNNVGFGMIFPCETIATQNGLTAGCGNSVYSGFAAPAYVGMGGVQAGLELYGDSPTVPEPSSLLLLGTGLLGGWGAMRRRLHR